MKEYLDVIIGVPLILILAVVSIFSLTITDNSEEESDPDEERKIRRNN